VYALIMLATGSYSNWSANAPRTADAAGRYELTNLPVGATIHVQASMDGTVQQCAAPPLVSDRNLHLDVLLIARADLSASPDSVPRSAPGFRLVSGVVYEGVADGRRPASNVFVSYEPLDNFPAAMTYTDAEGRFLLCGIPSGDRAFIYTGLGSRVEYREVPPGPDTAIEIEIR
jgi:hypothetical protein